MNFLPFFSNFKNPILFLDEFLLENNKKMFIFALGLKNVTPLAKKCI